MTPENTKQLTAKFQDQIDRAWTAHAAAQTLGNHKLARLHAVHANEMAELIEGIEDGSVGWCRKLPLAT